MKTSSRAALVRARLRRRRRSGRGARPPPPGRVVILGLRRRGRARRRGDARQRGASRTWPRCRSGAATRRSRPPSRRRRRSPGRRSRRARSGRPRDLRLPEARPGQPHPDLRRRRGDSRCRSSSGKNESGGRSRPARRSCFRRCRRCCSRGGAGGSSRSLLLVLARRAAPAARSWRRGPGCPRRGPWVRNNRRGPVVLEEAGARPATVIRMPVTFPPEAFADGTHALGPGRAGPLGPHRQARVLHVGSVLRAARGQRLLGRDHAARIQRRAGRSRGSPALRASAFGREGTIDLPDDPHGARRAGPPDRRGGQRARRAEARAVERLALARLPRQPAHHRARLRAVAARHGRSRRSASTCRRSSSIRSGCRRASRISSPPGFAKELVERFGRYKTMGWAHRHLVDPVGDALGGGVPRGRRARPCEQERKMLGGLLAGKAEAALPLLRVSRPRGARVLAPARPAAPGLRRGARREVRRRRREVLRDDGRRSSARRRRRSSPRTS